MCSHRVFYRNVREQQNGNFSTAEGTHVAGAHCTAYFLYVLYSYSTAGAGKHYELIPLQTVL